MFHFKEVVVENKDKTRKKKSLVIEFEEKKNRIIGTFLMTDAPLLDYEVLDVIDRVLTGDSEKEVSSGNRCMLEIKRDETCIEDLFVGIMKGDEILPEVTIQTKKLRDLIMMWKNKQEAMGENE